MQLTQQNKTEQILWLSRIHGWENLIDRKMSCQDTAGVERKQLWKGRSPGECPQGTLCNIELQSSG